MVYRYYVSDQTAVDGMIYILYMLNLSRHCRCALAP
eukprot:SAG31_NODE_25799_length_453_cov_16.355932_1_plen_35_part_10